MEMQKVFGMKEDEYVEYVREQSDSYERTIGTIIAFDFAVRYDNKGCCLANSHFFPGRRLLTETTSPSKEITPDAVLQLTNNYGIVAEAKITASNEQDFEKAYEQIKKYDNELTGWKTPNGKIKLHDISLLVSDIKRNIARDYFLNKKFGKNFTLIASAIIKEDSDFLKIEKYEGLFSNRKIENKLKNPVAIPLEQKDIIKRISNTKFYDAEPPSVEYTMQVLWMNVFNEIKENEENRLNKTMLVSCKELTKMLEERYSFKQEDDHQPKIPREHWIKRALDAFVEMKYAIKDPQDGDKYHVKYSYARKGSMLESFARKYYAAMKKKQKKIKSVDARQLMLPSF